MKGIRCHSHLHEDLVIDILLRLPVKSLLRFKSVCKAWRAIISSPSFIQNHFHREGNCTTLLVYWSGDPKIYENFRIYGNLRISDKPYKFTMFCAENLERCEDADHRELPGHIFRMRGPCNGVFCVLHAGGALALWNPATRKLLEVPNSPLVHYARRVFDFGIDPLTGDFKIVVISGIGMIEKFAVYNSSNRSWRLLNQNFVQDADCSVVTESNYFGHTFSNGFCYWLKCNKQKSHFVILAFDLQNESFQELKMPENNLKPSVERQLYWYNDSLHLLAYQDVADETRVDVWSMKEHGFWTKVCNFSLPFIEVTSIGAWVKNQIFAVTLYTKLVTYDIESGTTKNLEFRTVEDAIFTVSLFAFPYKESLVSL